MGMTKIKEITREEMDVLFERRDFIYDVQQNGDRLIITKFYKDDVPVYRELQISYNNALIQEFYCGELNTVPYNNIGEIGEEQQSYINDWFNRNYNFVLSHEELSVEEEAQRNLTSWVEVQRASIIANETKNQIIDNKELDIKDIKKVERLSKQIIKDADKLIAKYLREVE
jgi:hypothetical protein